MNKKSIIAAVVMTVLLVTAVAAIFLHFSGHYEENGNVSEEAEKRDGVYYDALSIKDIGCKYDGMAQYAYDSLLYRNKIYTASTINYKQYSVEEFAVLSEKIIPLGKVYINAGVYASSDAAALYEVTKTGTLFCLEDYEEGNRVGIYCHYEKNSEGEEEHYTVEIYDCLNDIRVKQGKDMYQTMFRLEDAESIELAAGYDEEGERKIKKKLSFQDSIISDFFDAVCNGEFMMLKEREEESVPWTGQDWSNSNFLLFTDRYGIETEVYVYQEGYVLYRSPENTEFALRIDSKICEEILKMVH